ncbi:MAG: transcriptional regulator, partial [Solirubrobacteraceae bacterium]
GRVLAVDGRALVRDPTRDDGAPWRLPLPGPDGGPVLLPDGREGRVEPVGDDGYLVYAPARPGAARPAVAAELLGTTSPRARLGGPTPPDVRPVSRGHAEILALLTVHPEGLTADGLAALLHGDAANPTTARAACSRLRSRLPGVLLTRPYRLAPGVTSDLSEVRRHLAVGALRDAVDAYGGPLLPDSVAPGVVALAEDLHAELRGALLEAGDADALAAWCARPHGAGDLRAAETLVGVLPPGDPRRGVAAGRAQALRRRLGLAPTGLLQPAK